MFSQQHKCPVCGKAGISDYTKEEVVCPACNTDLCIYKTIATTSRNYKIWQILSGIFVLIIVCLFFFETLKQPDWKNERMLLDRINGMQSQVSLLTTQIDSLKSMCCEETEMLLYVVVKGDSFYKISRKLYKTEKYASEIASFNGLSLKEAIHPKMKLKIPPK